nr:(d)CMP kinase [Desulfobulbaceae bacterium]
MNTIITIDGPSGSGKSTISRLLAQRLNYTYLDTGAMYRAVGFAAQRQGLEIVESEAIRNMLASVKLTLLPAEGDTRVLLNGEDVSSAIRSADMAMVASKISALPSVRKKLTDLQQDQGKSGAIVAEGRDMGTVVFPEAKNKFFLSASAQERARRRTEQLKEKGQPAPYDDILKQIQQRDQDDSSRTLAPLKAADDAIIIDSSTMTIDEVVQFMINSIKS